MVPVLPLDADLLDVAFGFVERGSEGSALMSTTGRVSSLEHCGTCGRVIEWGFLIMEKTGAGAYSSHMNRSGILCHTVMCVSSAKAAAPHGKVCCSGGITRKHSLRCAWTSDTTSDMSTILKLS